MTHDQAPGRQGLYDPRNEHDSCGVGFVVDIKNRKSHDIVEMGIKILMNLEHRGACGCEKETGDGAGLLVQMPHKFLQQQCDRAGFTLPPLGLYGAGCVFLPTDPEDRRRCQSRFQRIVEEEGQIVLGWRTVPVDNTSLGPTARAAQPFIRQLFIGASSDLIEACRTDSLAFERKLYVIRRRIENNIRESTIGQRSMFYIPSLSSKTLIYKGMLNSDQVNRFYPEIHDPSMVTALVTGCSTFTLQHQYVPQLGAGASLSLHRPQRRDQHAARQHQLDDRPRTPLRQRPVRRRHQEGVAHHRTTRPGNGSEHVRQCAAGTARPVGAPAATRGHDDDPGAVERRSEHVGRKRRRSMSSTRF